MSKIKMISKKKISTERLYNFSVEGDESYICNGIVVHNCKSYILPVLKGDLGDQEINPLRVSPDAAKQIQFHDRCC